MLSKRTGSIVLLCFLVLSVAISVVACDGDGRIAFPGNRRDDFIRLVEETVQATSPSITFKSVIDTDEDVLLPGEAEEKKSPQFEETPNREEAPAIRQLGLNAQIPSNVFPKTRQPFRKYLIAPEQLTEQSTQLFPVNQYAPDFGADVMKKLSKTREICKAVEKHKLDENNFEKWSNILKDFKVKFSHKRLPGVEGEVSISLDILDDMLSALIITHLIPGEVRVFVRGFADSCGENKNCPIGRLLTNYNYPKVLVHPFIQPNKSNPEAFGWSSTYTDIETSIGRRYENIHLPNLRANFFKEEFLENLVNRCSYSKLSKEIGILQGRVDPNYDSEKRKIEAYLAIY